MQPTMLHERNQTLDIIRGFSLLGILLVNIFGFITPQPHINMVTWFTNAYDIIWHQILDIYVQSSFYPLFAILFGYGIALQFLKATERGQKLYPYVTKRIILLFIVGMIHAIFIWWGDILATYAFCAIFLVVLIRLPGWALIVIGVIVNWIGNGLYILLLIAMGKDTELVETFAVDIVKIQNSITAYGTGTWMDAFSQRLVDLSLQMSPFMWIFSLFIILPFMLIGAGLSKYRLIERAKSLKGLWITLAIFCTAVGITLKNLPYMFEYTYLLEYIKVYFGGPILALGYIAIIVVLCMLPVLQKLLSPIAKMGRMSLTMYLMQSIILSLLIYNFGFGLYGKLNVPTCVYVCLGIYVVQVIIAEVWFMKFSQGPLEAGMKRLIYGKTLSEK